MSHPVSGTREWGIKPDATNGGYVFYTTGVDRITDKLTEIIDDLISWSGFQSGFEDGDDLWRSLQDKMIEFINTHGGQAAKYSNVEVTARPDYSSENFCWVILICRLCGSNWDAKKYV